MLLWCDGFDHYGTDEDNMLDGAYAQASCALSTTHVATGNSAVSINSQDSSSNFQGLRKVLPATETKLGITARIYFPTLPTDNAANYIYDFLSASPNHSHIRVAVTSSGTLRFLRNGDSTFSGLSGGTLIAETDPIITAAAFHHIEVQLNIHDTLGWIRVAINGSHRFEATGLDTARDATECASIGFHSFYTLAHTWWMDDLIIYNFEGDSGVDTDFCPVVDGAGIATSYLGELQCMYLPPNGNTAEDDWDKSTGSSAFALVDETTPDDTDYLISDTAGDLTEMDLTDLPPEITYIQGLQLLGRMSKIDAGYAETEFGMKSVAATDDADARPVTVEPTYWWDFMNIDPNSGARWTRTSLNAAKFRLTRST